MTKTGSIAYFPYLFMEEDSVRCGDCEVWRFDPQAEDRIPDPEVRRLITRILSEYTSGERRVRGGDEDEREPAPLRGIGVFTHPDTLSYKLTEAAWPLVVETRLLLFLSYLAGCNMEVGGDNPRLGWVTAEHFTVVWQGFTVGQETTSFQGGAIVPVLSGGRRLGRPMEKPPYIVPLVGSRPDQDLLDVMVEVRQANQQLFLRILRSTEAFLGGYYNSPDQSPESSVLQQARAFEILFDLPGGRQKSELLRAGVRTHCVASDEPTREVDFGQGGPQPATEAEIWITDFYRLRNAIAHGDELSPGDFSYQGERHIDISVRFFVTAVKGLINEELGRVVFGDVLRWEDGRFQCDRLHWKLEEVARRLDLGGPGLGQEEDEGSGG